jgi:hypothetical protein
MGKPLGRRRIDQGPSPDLFRPFIIINLASTVSIIANVWFSQTVVNDPPVSHNRVSDKQFKNYWGVSFFKVVTIHGAQFPAVETSSHE